MHHSRADLALLFALSLTVLPNSRASAEPLPLPEKLNLASMARTVRAPQDLSGPVSISNGSTSTQVTPGMLLTPAQAVAVQQVLSSGSQSIVLGANGNAIAGTVTLPAGQALSSLRVPSGVTVLGDFSATGQLGMSGNLINSGTIYAYSNNPANTNATILAQNISNNSTGVISSIIPAGMFSGVNPGNLSLSLIALQSIINNGSITSSAGLNLIAPQISNISTGSASAVISAAGDLNIATAVLNNSGLLRSDFANINLATQLNSNAVLSNIAAQNNLANLWSSSLNNLNVDSNGGTVQALLGTININVPDALKDHIVSISGGDWLSNVLNVAAGEGRVNISANNISGLLNMDAGCAYAGSWTGDLALGTINISGDPTFFSTSNLSIGTNINSNGEAVSLLAAQDVTITSAVVDTDGGNLTIVAGAKLTTKATKSPADAPVTVSGASTTGGNIVCDACTLDTSGTTKGGKLLMAAYTFAGAGGDITFVNGSSAKTDSSSGTAGDITIIAPGTIAVDLDAFGAKGGPKITITGSQPAGSLTADVKGNAGVLSAGAIVPGSTINFQDLDAPGATIKAKADTITLLGGALVDVSGQTGQKGGSVELTGGKAVNLNTTALLFANGGAGASSGAGGNGGSISLSAADITLLANAQIRVDAGSGGKALDGAAGKAGSINGGNGGNGGKGGNGGSIVISSSSSLSSAANAFMTANGGNGGDGGDGGDGFDTAGGKGGNGGSGGASGSGGNIKITNKSTNAITIPGIDIFVSVSGPGDGGNGGTGGDNSSGAGGAGGNGGPAGVAASGGKLEISSLGTISLLDNFYRVDGSPGGNGGSGGDGGKGTTTGGNGGNGAAATSAGSAGKLSISGSEIGYQTTGTTVTLQTLGAKGGGGGGGGLGGDGPNAGAGGKGSPGGKGGNGGSISVTAAGFGKGIFPEVAGKLLSLLAPGGDSGFSGGGGDGGIGTVVSGKGGDGSLGASGGKGGSIVISAPFSTLDNGTGTTQEFNANGGDGFGSSGGGTGGSPVNGKGGDGGKGANAGSGGAAGTISINAGNIDFGGDMSASGGNGGSGASGGGGGSSTFDAGGKAGAGTGNGGNGGAAGKITLTFANDLTVQASSNIFARGGIGGPSAGGEFGGSGKSDKPGAAGAAGGNGGLGGAGGAITISGGFTSGTGITLNNNSEVSVNAGRGGSGGDGGTGSDGTTGGAGAAGGNAGNGANGGSIKINTISLFQSSNSTISANGGDGIFGGSAGPAGNSTAPVGKGIAGAKGGNGSNGGKSGQISITLANSDYTNNGSIELLAGDGGNGGDGAIGSKGDSKSAGGAGGAGGNAGNGGASGKFTLSNTLDSGDIVRIAFTDLDSKGGSGGNGGLGADGQTGGSAGGNGGSGGKGGTGASGGTVSYLVAGKVTFADPILSVLGGFGGNAGSGGKGAGATPAGGKGGDSGLAGTGGAAGSITIQTKASILPSAGSDAITIEASGGDSGLSGNGGNGGDGFTPGAGGVGGSTSSGGKAGLVTLKANGAISTGSTGGVGSIKANGGVSNTAGTGGDAGSSLAAQIAGAKGGTGNNGGAGGKISISTTDSSATVTLFVGMEAKGGNGGQGGVGGAGGNSTLPDGGTGGPGGSGGIGGAGGAITVSAIQQIDMNNTSLPIEVTGGNGGNGGSGGTGGGNSGAGGKGGIGGLGGNGKAGGIGGIINISASGAASVINGGNAQGNSAAGFTGNGGQGGTGGAAPTGTGGKGGNGGNSVNGSNGGDTTVFAATFNKVTSKFNVAGALAGAGGLGGNGGAGGTVGGKGAAGSGGTTTGKDGALNLSFADECDDDGQKGGPLIKKKRRNLADGTTVEFKDRIDANSDTDSDKLKPVAFVLGPDLSAEDLRMNQQASRTKTYLIHSDQKDMTASIASAKVLIAKGSIVIIARSENNELSVLCLHERKSGDVELIAKGKRIRLHSSEQAVLSNESSKSANSMSVAIRNQKQEALPENHILTLSQFSIPSAIFHYQIDQKLRKAGKEKELAAILKNAAVIQTAFQHKGPFKLPRSK